MKQIATALLALVLLPLALQAQQWQKRPDVPFGETDAPIGFTIDDKVYLGAGVGNKRFYEYDPQTMKWTRKADIPGVTGERAFASGFAIGGKGYVGFGYDGSPQTKKDLWEYDPTTDKWTRKADLPGEARDGATVFVVGGKAYVGGGSDNEVLFQDLWSYDPTQDAWKQLNDLPAAVIFQSSFVIDNKAYIACGSVGAIESNETYRYDPVKDEWTKRADYPGAARQAAATFVYDGKGYVGFGHSGFTEVFNDFYSYDPGSNSWTLVSDPSVPTGRAWATGVSLADRAFIGTGFDLQVFYNDWWEYNFPVNHAPVFDPVPTQTIQAGSMMNLVVTAQDSDNDPMNVTVVHKPSWIAIEPIDIVGKCAVKLIGMPMEYNIGDTTVRLRVSDDEMAVGEVLITVRVVVMNHAPNEPIAILPENNTEVKRGETIRFTWYRTGDPDPQDIVTYDIRIQSFQMDTSIMAGYDTTVLFTVPNSMPLSSYSWMVTALDMSDAMSVSTERTLTVLEAAGVERDEEIATPMLYPNPASKQVALHLTDASKVTIYDQLGRSLEILTVDAGVSQIDLHHLPSGVYHVRIVTGSVERTEVLHVTQ